MKHSILLAQSLAMIAGMGLLQADDRPIAVLRRREPDEDFVNPYADDNAPRRSKAVDPLIIFDEPFIIKSGERYDKAEAKRQRKAEKRLRAE